jgi:hypothetical protein
LQPAFGQVHNSHACSIGMSAGLDFTYQLAEATLCVGLGSSQCLAPLLSPSSTVAR